MAENTHLESGHPAGGSTHPSPAIFRERFAAVEISLPPGSLGSPYGEIAADSEQSKYICADFRVDLLRRDAGLIPIGLACPKTEMGPALLPAPLSPALIHQDRRPAVSKHARCAVSIRPALTPRAGSFPVMADPMDRMAFRFPIGYRTSISSSSSLARPGCSISVRGVPIRPHGYPLICLGAFRMFHMHGTRLLRRFPCLPPIA